MVTTTKAPVKSLAELEQYKAKAQVKTAVADGGDEIPFDISEMRFCYVYGQCQVRKLFQAIIQIFKE